MTVPPKRPDDSHPRIPEDQRVMGSYELQLRNLLGVQRHARPVVERLEGQRGLTEQAGQVLDYMDSVNLDGWISAVAALRQAIETERQ